jgi:pimeloyl-ACP methyl ester carboxylesterase
MDRRTLLALPLAAASASAWSGSAAATTALHTEEFKVATRDPGIQIYLRNKRPESGGRFDPRRTLLLVHGLTYAGSAVFDLPLGGESWMDFIASRGFDIWCVDIRGYGRSTRPAQMAEPATANPPLLDAATATRDLEDAVSFILAHRGLSRVSLLAWSWGTVLAARFAGERPERVERLALYAPVWLWQGPGPSPAAPSGAWRGVTQVAARSGWLGQAPEAHRDGLLPVGWFDQWAASVWATDPEGARMDPPVLRVPNGPLAEVAANWAAGRPPFDPSRISAPTLLVVGEWDRTTPPAQATALLPLLTRTPVRRLAVLPEGTHSFFLERNRRMLFATVQAFLEASE